MADFWERARPRREALAGIDELLVADCVAVQAWLDLE